MHIYLNLDYLENLIQILKDNSIKNIKLPVSAPFHCNLMNNATKIMTEELNKLNFKNGQNFDFKNLKYCTYF